MGIEKLDWQPQDPELRAGLESMTGPLPEEGVIRDLERRIVEHYGRHVDYGVADRINGVYGQSREIAMAHRIIDWYGYHVDGEIEA